jgi:methylenetetrahydrofolate reductase (NADPH)
MHPVVNLMLIMQIMNLSHITGFATRGHQQERAMPVTPRLSFEFFPPQTLDASFRLWETVQVLAPPRHAVE